MAMLPQEYKKGKHIFANSLRIMSYLLFIKKFLSKVQTLCIMMYYHFEVRTINYHYKGSEFFEKGGTDYE